MTAASKSLTYRIGADYGDLRRKMEETTALTSAQRKEFFALQRQQREHRQTITELGMGMTAFGAATLLGMGIATKAAIDWESAFAGVRKTVDGSDAEIASLEGELRQLARTLPATHEEIAGVAEAAGQLGIKRKDIAEFTKTMIDLGNTTNLTAEEAATDLAKFSNIMGTSARDVDRLGSALVALGNDGASTEKDIVEMALRIAGAGKQIGLTESQVLGFASALSSVGIEAEAGGSSISTTMIKIASAVNSGGKELDTFAKIAGLSGEQFATTFRTDAAGAIIMFIQGLARMQRAGENVFGVLDDLGLSDIRVRDALLRASSASDLFTKSLQVGSTAWAENTALANEANKRYDTSASKLAVAGNQIKDTLIDIGAALAPIAAAGAQAGSDIAKGFQQLPGPLRDVATWVGVAAGGLALFGGAAAVAAPKVMDFRDKMRDLEASGGAVSRGLGKFGLFLSGPWGVALGVAAGLLGVFAGAAGGAARRQEELASAGKSVAQAIREQNGVVNESVVRTAAKAAEDHKMLSTAKSLGVEMGTVTSAILGQGDAYNQLKTRLQEIIKADSQTVTGGKSGTFTQFGDQARAAQELLKNLDDLVGGKNAELQATKNVDEATKQATTSTQKLAKSEEQLKKEAEDSAKALDELLTALDKINGVELTYREAQRGYIEQLGKTADVLKENGKGLDINTEKGRANARALDDQAKAASELAAAAAREAEAHGGAAAGAEAMTASLQASRPELVKQAIAFGMSKAEAEKYADAVLAIPPAAPVLITTPGSKEAAAELQTVKEKVAGIPPNKEVNVGVISQAAIKVLEDLGYKVKTLPNGEVVVSGNTQPAQTQLDEYIRRNNGRRLVLYVDTIGGTRRVKDIEIYGAYGAMVSFARGGMHEDHRPQIATAQPGTVRVWAEPDTVRESYIPWAMDRRAGATDVLRATARGFGFDLVPRSQPVGMRVGGSPSTAPPLNPGHGGITVENLNVQAYSDRFSLSQVMNDIAMSGVS